MIPVFQDPVQPRTTGLIGYWIRCLLGTQPLRWTRTPTPSEVRMQNDNYQTMVFWQLSRTMAEIESSYGLLEPVDHYPRSNT